MLVIVYPLLKQQDQDPQLHEVCQEPQDNIHGGEHPVPFVGLY